MTNEEARIEYQKLYGEVTDEEWAEITEGVTDFDAFLADKAATIGADDAADEGADEADTTASDPGDDGDVTASLRTEIAELRSMVGDLTGQLRTMQMTTEEREAEAARNLAASEIAATEISADGHQFRLAASAVEVLASLRVNPSAETSQALIDHLVANGGRLCMIGLDRAAAVDAGDGRPDPDAEILASWGEDTEAVTWIKAEMEREGVTAAEAHRRYLKRGAGARS